MKPLINIDELVYESHADGDFVGQYAVIGEKIGAKQLGFNISICPPGKKVCPFHSHYHEEEMVFILEGEGTLRFGKSEYKLRKGDFVSFPTGGPEVAHQIINTGQVDLKYFALSTKSPTEIAEYPDSNKVGVYVGTPGARSLKALFKHDSAVDYFEGES